MSNADDIEPQPKWPPVVGGVYRGKSGPSRHVNWVNEQYGAGYQSIASGRRYYAKREPWQAWVRERVDG